MRISFSSFKHLEQICRILLYYCDKYSIHFQDHTISLWTHQSALLPLLQDAHEFLNFLLNELVDILEKEHKAMRESLPNHSSQKTANGRINGQSNGSHKELASTWVHNCFQVRFQPFPRQMKPFQLLCLCAYCMLVNSINVKSLEDEPYSYFLFIGHIDK